MIYLVFKKPDFKDECKTKLRGTQRWESMSRGNAVIHTCYCTFCESLKAHRITLNELAKWEKNTLKCVLYEFWRKTTLADVSRDQ